MSNTTTINTLISQYSHQRSIQSSTHQYAHQHVKTSRHQHISSTPTQHQNIKTPTHQHTQQHNKSSAHQHSQHQHNHQSTNRSTHRHTFSLMDRLTRQHTNANHQHISTLTHPTSTYTPTQVCVRMCGVVIWYRGNQRIGDKSGVLFETCSWSFCEPNWRVSSALNNLCFLDQEQESLKEREEALFNWQGDAVKRFEQEKAAKLKVHRFTNASTCDNTHVTQQSVRTWRAF